MFTKQLHEIPMRTYMGECTHVHLCAGTGTDWKDVHPNVKGTVSGDGIMVDFFPPPPIVNVIFNRKKKKERKLRGIPWWPNG